MPTNLYPHRRPTESPPAASAAAIAGIIHPAYSSGNRIRLLKSNAVKRYKILRWPVRSRSSRILPMSLVVWKLRNSTQPCQDQETTRK